MPPLPRVKLPLIADLLAQLRYAPREALLRIIHAAEALAIDLDPRETYPEDWIAFRLTGFRPPGSTRAPATIPGERVLADLGPCVELLSDRAGLSRADFPDWPDERTLAREWQTSVKTLARLRRRGLIARRVRRESHRPVLIFNPELARAFRERYVAPQAWQKGSGAGAASRASGLPRLASPSSSSRPYSRMSPRDRQRAVRRAAKYRARFGCSLNQAAKRIAARLGRSLEAVRQVLIAHDAKASVAIFDRSPPLGDAAGADLFEQWRRGVSPEALAKAQRKAPPAVLRAINTARAAHLRALSLPVAASPPDVDTLEALLKPPVCRQGLHRAWPETIGEWAALARAAPPPALASERAWARAARGLEAHAAGAVERLPNRGASSPELDEIETNLRWARRLRTLLIRNQWGTMLRAIEAAATRPIDRVRPGLAQCAIAAAHLALDETLDRFDPDRGGRLAGAAAVPLQRALAGALGAEPAAAVGAASSAARAAPAGALAAPFPVISLGASGWAERFEAPEDVERFVLEAPSGAGTDAAHDAARQLLSDRFGFAGPPPPSTIRAMAKRAKLPEVVMARRVREAIALAVESTKKAGR